MAIGRPEKGQEPVRATASVRASGLILLALLLAPSAASLSPPVEWTIRPGSWMDAPSLCTLGFVFHHDGTDRFGIVTAGHCARVGQRVAVRTPAFEGDALGSAWIGTTAMSIAGGPGNDLALVLVDRALEPRIEPTAALVGGPCGVASTTAGTPLAHVGHPGGAGAGLAPTARPGIAAASDDATIVWTGAAYRGDSGGPVVDAASRSALGIATHTVTLAGVPTGTVKGTSLARILELLPGWGLVESPSC